MARDRAEGFLAIEVAVVRHVLQQRRLAAWRPCACRRTSSLRAACRRRLDPAFEALGRVLVDHRADEGLLVAADRRCVSVLATADLSLSRSFVVDVGVDEDALHADAALAGLVEGAEHDALDHGVEVEARIVVDDARRVAAEFQHHLLLAGARLQVPADQAAGEAEQLEALVGRPAGRRRRCAGQDRERALRQVGLGQHLADDQRADRRAAPPASARTGSRPRAPARPCARPG